MFRAFKLSTVSIAAVCLLIAAAWGDSLQLKNGSLIKGTYLGGTATEINFQVGSTVQRYAVADVVSVSFESENRVAQPNGTPQFTPRPVQPPVTTAPTVAVAPHNNSVNVPSGTRILIRTIDAIDSDRNQVGDRFQASLEEPLIVDDIAIAPKGASVYGRLTHAAEAGHIQGRSELRLELTGLVVNGQTVPLVTGDYSVSGSSRGATSAKRIGAGTAVGAVIGALAGGGKGAAIGAGVGAGAGTAVQVMTKGEQVHVPSETLLEFTLQQDVRMPIATASWQPGR